MSNYIVKEGESITDVVVNSTGSILYWNDVLNANNFTEWSPVLTIGQNIIIPDLVMDNNTIRQLSIYPICNATIPDIYDQIAVLKDLLDTKWILKTGFWDDNSVWNDSQLWID